MKKDYSYAREKLWDAICSLATGPEDVRSRLKSAYLKCHTLSSENFPPELRKNWEHIKNELTKIRPVVYDKEPEIGALEATLYLIDNKTGSNVAKEILDLYSKLNLSKFQG